MSFAVNKVIILGNLGADPKIQTLGNGTKVATLSVATTESYKDKAGEYQDQTEWHRIVAWGWLADLAEKNLKKGSKVYIEGKLKTRSYEQDGITKFTTDIVAKEIITMSSGERRNTPPPPSQSDAPTQGAKKQVENENTDEDEVEDLPF